ncbi:MAG: YkgJ family cysteine cluster protein [Desulfosarcinaceae bacterium]|nr:YkgJ family cysteine cluster protein [Desulfosarcinaceae bacterium]
MAVAFEPLTPQQTFRFACHPKVPCFNHCCRDLTQHLTPYDILRLKACLNLTSDAFLKAYTLENTGPRSGLPIITLKPIGQERRCPFVTASGCRVYADRPASCRTYPLARAVGIRPGNGERIEQFALIREPHCQGFRAAQRQTAAEWVADQELALYNEMNDLLLRLIQQKTRRGKPPLTPSERNLFHLALYDLDRFRSRLAAGGLRGAGDLPSTLAADTARTGDDVDLLRFAIQWVEAVLFP